MFSAAEPRETKTVSASSRLVLGDQPVVAAGQVAEVLVSRFEEVENRLGKVVAPGHHALHVVFLVLHRPQQDRVGQVHHLGNAPARGSKEHALRFGRALDDVIGRAEVFADQLRSHACRRCAPGALVRNPSMMFMPGVRESSVTRRRIRAWSAACCASLPKIMIQPVSSAP